MQSRKRRRILMQEAEYGETACPQSDRGRAENQQPS